jgi:maltoporin
MSKRKLKSDEDTSQEESDEDQPSKVFQFIDLSNNDPDLQKKNLFKARSHAMKVVRQRMRIEEKKRKLEEPSSTELIVLQDPYSQAVLASMNQSFLDYASSPLSSIETDIAPTLISQLRWSPLAHRMIHHSMLRNADR